MKKGFIWKRFRESCAYVDSLVTSVFFLFCLNNVIFLLSLLTHPTLAYIYLILSFFKYQTKLPWIKTGFSYLTIDIPILAVWRKFVIIDSVYRPATSLLQLNGGASEVLIGRSQVRLLILAHRVLFSWVYLCHSLKDIIFHSLFSWKCCLFGWKVWESFRNNLYGTTLHVPSFWYLAMIENKYTVIAYFCLYFDSVVPLSISTYLKLRPNKKLRPYAANRGGKKNRSWTYNKHVELGEHEMWVIHLYSQN